MAYSWVNPSKSEKPPSLAQGKIVTRTDKDQEDDARREIEEADRENDRMAAELIRILESKRK